MSLHDLLRRHRVELIRTCCGKVARRYEPSHAPSVVDHGVPLFLAQLVETLQNEQASTARPAHDPMPSPVDSPIGRAASLHGTELLRLGYTVDQVVHHYGDVCQAITELAVRKNASITADEFRTLNRSIDEAIADAVTAFGAERESAILDLATDLHHRLGELADEQRRLIDIALLSVAAIQSGGVATRGATASALVSTLQQLRDLIEKSLPEVRLSTGITTTPPRI